MASPAPYVRVQRFANVAATSGEHAVRVHATDDDWRRGFAEPDVEDDDPPRGRPPLPGRVGAPVDDAGAGVADGTDDAHVITVSVDRSGAVSDVLVSPAWRDSVRPHALGQALLTAANNALIAHLTAEVERMDAAAAAERPAAGGAAPDWDMREVAELLNRFDRDLESYRGQLEAATHVDATASGPGGRVTVSMTPGRVTGVVADPRWATHTRYTEIRAEARAAFRAATHGLGSTDPSTVPIPSSLARLRELSDELARATVEGNRA
jgi:hypothetical protein